MKPIAVMAACALIAGSACSPSAHRGTTSVTHRITPTTGHALPAPPPARRELAPIVSLSIDAIGLRARVGEGLARTTLDLGPSHDPSSGLPGTGRTIVIVGHRTTHTEPFFHLNEIAPGSEIVLENRAAEAFNYKVVATVVATPAEVGKVEHQYDGDLVLVTNTPLYTARQRLLVVARPSATT